MKKVIHKNMFIGELIELSGGVYKVERLYQVSGEYMEEHNLYHKDRVKLVKVSGEGQESLEVAVG